ncbi:hypothetical protein OG840_61630 [Streptomyces sp. NBC_01764]|uniref:hypothetical protein n=1 Tax=Streptomyces sp. NBC_01764 TaxID=2975935 RepID=UPI002255AB17|nr:hypothetical protein [Streptomyces sp. NBC_01764]MCX4411594.1 hypothetical protein [Streptomyces sp. NBC_01764]
MKITIEGASEEFAEKVVRLAAQQGAELTVATVQTGWTVDRAERYLRSLTGGARRFAEMVILDGNGYIDADQLRSVIGRLNGPTVALSRAVPRGVKKGWWPEGTPAPINPVSDPDNPSWHQNIAYRMDAGNVPVFREALARLAFTQQAARAAGLHPGGAGKTSASWTPDPSMLEGSPDVKSVDLDGGSLPDDDDQDDDGVMECHVCLQPYEVDEQGTASHLDTARDADHTPRS